MQSQLENQQTRYTDLPFDLHVGELDTLLADARRETVPRHLVITATDLHQRNIEDRLRRQNRPQSNFRFRRIGELADDITRPSPAVSSAMDRVDRLRLIREVVASTEDPVYDYLAAVLGSPLEKHIERIERTRSEFELVTGFQSVSHGRVCVDPRRAKCPCERRHTRFAGWCFSSSRRPSTSTD